MTSESHRIARPILLTTVIMSVFFFSLYAMAGNKKLPDPGQPGPYAAGHRTYIFTDASRPTADY